MSSYKVSEPNTLKFLKANGAVVDENGNVVSDTSDYWKKVYDQAEPKPDKILHSDGTIKDAAGNLIQDTTSFNVKKYNQAEPLPAKYLHADGTIDENPGGGSGSGLEFNCPEWLQDKSKIPPQGIKIYVSKGVDGDEIKKTYFITNGTDSFETQFEAKMIEWQGSSNGYFQACGNVGDDVYVGYEYIPG